MSTPQGSKLELLDATEVSAFRHWVGGSSSSRCLGTGPCSIRRNGPCQARIPMMVVLHEIADSCGFRIVSYGDRSMGLSSLLSIFLD